MKIKLIRTPKMMTYRRQKEENWSYSFSEMWSYLSREGGIWE